MQGLKTNFSVRRKTRRCSSSETDCHVLIDQAQINFRSRDHLLAPNQNKKKIFTIFANSRLHLRNLDKSKIPTQNFDTIFYKICLVLYKKYELSLYYHKKTQALNISRVKPRKFWSIHLEPFLPLLKVSKLVSTELPLNMDYRLYDLYRSCVLKRVLFSNTGDQQQVGDMLKPIFLQLKWSAAFTDCIQQITDTNLKQARVLIEEESGWDTQFYNRFLYDIRSRHRQYAIFDKSGMLSLPVRNALTELFNEVTTANPGRMSRSDLAKYINGCTGEEDTTEHDRRVEDIFFRHDEDSDGFLQLQDFLDFYEDSRFRSYLIWRNLSSYSYSYEMKRENPKILKRYDPEFVLKELNACSECELADYNIEAEYKMLVQLQSSLETGICNFIRKIELELPKPSESFKLWQKLQNLQILGLKFPNETIELPFQLFKDLPSLINLTDLTIDGFYHPVIQKALSYVLMIKNLKSFRLILAFGEILDQTNWALNTDADNDYSTDLKIFQEADSRLEEVKLIGLSGKKCDWIKNFLKVLTNLKDLTISAVGSSGIFFEHEFYNEVNLYTKIESLCIRVTKTKFGEFLIKYPMVMNSFKKLKSLTLEIPMLDWEIMKKFCNSIVKNEMIEYCWFIVIRNGGDANVETETSWALFGKKIQQQLKKRRTCYGRKPNFKFSWIFTWD